MNEDPFAWNGNYNNRIWGRQTWVRLLKNMRPRHPPKPDWRAPNNQPPELTKEDELYRMMRRNQLQEDAQRIANTTDVGYNSLQAHNFYADKINTLRGNVDQLSQMQNQVNQLKAQFYGRGQGVATQTHPAARNKREATNPGKYDTLTMAVDRQIERDYNEARMEAKNVNRVDEGDVSTLFTNATPNINDLIMGPTEEDLTVLDAAMKDAKARNAATTTTIKVHKAVDSHQLTAAQTGIEHAAIVEKRHAKAEADQNRTRPRKTKMVMRNGEQVEVSDDEEDNEEEEEDGQTANQSLQQQQPQSQSKSPTKSKKSTTAKKTAKKSTKSKRPIATNTTTPTIESEGRALESVNARQYTQGRDVIVPKTAKKSLKKSSKLNKLVTQHRHPVSTQQAVAVLVETRQQMDKMLHALENEMDLALDQNGDGVIDDGEMDAIQSKLGHLQTLIDQTMRDTHNQLLRTQHMHRYEVESENIRQEMWQRQAQLQREQRQQQELEDEQQRAAATSLLNRARNRSAGDGNDDGDDDELNLGQFLNPQPVQFRQQQPDGHNDQNNQFENDAANLQNRVLFHHFDPNQLTGGEDELEVDVIPLFNNNNNIQQDVDMVVNPAIVALQQAEVANHDPLAMPDNTVAREVLQQQQHHRNLLRQQQAPSPSLGGMSGVIAGGLRFGGVLAPSPSINPLHSTPRRQFSTYGNESPLGGPAGPQRPGQGSANHNHIDLGGQSRHQFPQSPSITSLKSQELAQQRKTKEVMTPTMGAANKKIADMVNNTNNRENETGFMNSFSLDSDIYTSQDVLQLIKREERQYEQDQRMSSSRAAKADVINSMKRGSSIPRNQNGDNTTLNFSFAVPKPIPQDKPSSSTPFTQPLQPPQVIQGVGGNLKHTPQFQQQFMAGLGKTPTKNVGMAQGQSPSQQQQQQPQQQSKPKQAALPGTPVSIGKRRYSSRAVGSGLMEPVEFDSNSNSIAALSLDHDLMTTSTTIPVNSIMGVSPTQSPVEIDHQLAFEQSQIMANHPAVQQQQQQPIITTSSKITDRGVSLAQIDARNSDTNLLEQQHQVFDRDGYQIPGIDVNLVNSVRFTHQPGRANQLSVTNDVVPRSGDSML